MRWAQRSAVWPMCFSLFNMNLYKLSDGQGGLKAPGL